MGEGVQALLGGLVGGLEVLGDLVDPLADSRVAWSHHGEARKVAADEGSEQAELTSSGALVTLTRSKIERRLRHACADVICR